MKKLLFLIMIVFFTLLSAIKLEEVIGDNYDYQEDSMNTLEEVRHNCEINFIIFLIIIFV